MTNTNRNGEIPFGNRVFPHFILGVPITNVYEEQVDKDVVRLPIIKNRMEEDNIVGKVDGEDGTMDGNADDKEIIQNNAFTSYIQVGTKRKGCVNKETSLNKRPFNTSVLNNMSSEDYQANVKLILNSIFGFSKAMNNNYALKYYCNLPYNEENVENTENRCSIPYQLKNIISRYLAKIDEIVSKLEIVEKAQAENSTIVPQEHVSSHILEECLSLDYEDGVLRLEKDAKPHQRHISDESDSCVINADDVEFSNSEESDDYREEYKGNKTEEDSLNWNYYQGYHMLVSSFLNEELNKNYKNLDQFLHSNHSYFSEKIATIILDPIATQYLEDIKLNLYLINGSLYTSILPDLKKYYTGSHIEKKQLKNADKDLKFKNSTEIINNVLTKLESLSRTHLRDFMKPTMKETMHYIEFVSVLIKYASQMQNSFSVSSYLRNNYTHNADNLMFNDIQKWISKKSLGLHNLFPNEYSSNSEFGKRLFILKNKLKNYNMDQLFDSKYINDNDDYNSSYSAPLKPTAYDILKSNGLEYCTFTLSWVLTWFANDLLDISIASTNDDSYEYESDSKSNKSILAMIHRYLQVRPPETICYVCCILIISYLDSNHDKHGIEELLPDLQVLPKNINNLIIKDKSYNGNEYESWIKILVLTDKLRLLLPRDIVEHLKKNTDMQLIEDKKIHSPNHDILPDMTNQNIDNASYFGNALISKDVNQRLNLIPDDEKYERTNTRAIKNKVETVTKDDLDNAVTIKAFEFQEQMEGYINLNSPISYGTYILSFTDNNAINKKMLKTLPISNRIQSFVHDVLESDCFNEFITSTINQNESLDTLDTTVRNGRLRTSSSLSVSSHCSDSTSTRTESNLFNLIEQRFLLGTNSKSLIVNRLKSGINNIGIFSSNIDRFINNKYFTSGINRKHSTYQFYINDSSDVESLSSGDYWSDASEYGNYREPIIRYPTLKEMERNRNKIILKSNAFNYKLNLDSNINDNTIDNDLSSDEEIVDTPYVNIDTINFKPDTDFKFVFLTQDNNHTQEICVGSPTYQYLSVTSIDDLLSSISKSNNYDKSSYQNIKLFDKSSCIYEYENNKVSSLLIDIILKSMTIAIKNLRSGTDMFDIEHIGLNAEFDEFLLFDNEVDNLNGKKLLLSLFDLAVSIKLLIEKENDSIKSWNTLLSTNINNQEELVDEFLSNDGISLLYYRSKLGNIFDGFSEDQSIESKSSSYLDILNSLKDIITVGIPVIMNLSESVLHEELYHEMTDASSMYLYNAKGVVVTDLKLYKLTSEIFGNIINHMIESNSIIPKIFDTNMDFKLHDHILTHGGKLKLFEHYSGNSYHYGLMRLLNNGNILNLISEFNELSKSKIKKFVGERFKSNINQTNNSLKKKYALNYNKVNLTSSMIIVILMSLGITRFLSMGTN